MKIGKLISSFIVGIILAFSLFGCTEKANSIKKAFEKEGYEWHQIEEINDVELIDNIYYVTNNKIPTGIIIDFNGDDATNVLKTLKEENVIDNAALKAIIESYNDVPVTNGDCMIISITPKTLEIFKNA